ncbi:hypothetical protein NLG97_g9382 [Lecanicillium saksenae]|uniref:Uncharacterized protein n=1 Tax=Lecanicillium saksenae TaxID=468837 RepID=A0ACC1QK46_9HYPO|nr:hypothetical protein NLG97_g9382 [Lecanicillium saksenae]
MDVCTSPTVLLHTCTSPTCSTDRLFFLLASRFHPSIFSLLPFLIYFQHPLPQARPPHLPKSSDLSSPGLFPLGTPRHHTRKTRTNIHTSAIAEQIKLPTGTRLLGTDHLDTIAAHHQTNYTVPHPAAAVSPLLPPRGRSPYPGSSDSDVNLASPQPASQPASQPARIAGARVPFTYTPPYSIQIQLSILFSPLRPPSSSPPQMCVSPHRLTGPLATTTTNTTTTTTPASTCTEDTIGTRPARRQKAPLLVLGNSIIVV